MNRKEFCLVFCGNMAIQLAEWTGFSAITFLILREGGVAEVSVSQGLPLAFTIICAPFIGALADHWSARAVAAWSSVVLGLLGMVCFSLAMSWHGYALALLLSALLLTAYNTAYVRLLVVGGKALDRALGWISATSSAIRMIGFGVGPYVTYHAGSQVFLIVAIFYAVAALLFLGMPRGLAAITPERAGASPGQRGLDIVTSSLRQIKLAIEHMAHSRLLVKVLGLQALVVIYCAVEEATSLRIAQDHLRMSAQWAGVYPAIAYLGGTVGAAILACNLVTSSGAVVSKLAAAVVCLAMTAAALLLTDSGVIGFGLKFVEGMLLAITGLLSHICIVFRSDMELRGRMQAMLMASMGLALIVGKGVTAVLASSRTAVEIFGGTAMCIGLLVVAIAVTQGLTRARASRPREAHGERGASRKIHRSQGEER